jgi:serine acetyltransferase
MNIPRDCIERKLARLVAKLACWLGGWNLKQEILRSDFAQMAKVCEAVAGRSEIDSFLDFKGVRSLAYYRWQLGSGRFPKRMLALLLKQLFPGHLGLYINCTKIGSGFVPYHAMFAVIGAAEIGHNFCVYQGVTIGHAPGGAPTIGNNVTVFSNACIIGPVHIGDNAVIGAGSVVMKDVPEGAIVMGNPARIMARRS